MSFKEEILNIIEKFNDHNWSWQHPNSICIFGMLGKGTVYLDKFDTIKGYRLECLQPGIHRFTYSDFIKTALETKHPEEYKILEEFWNKLTNV